MLKGWYTSIRQERATLNMNTAINLRFVLINGSVRVPATLNMSYVNSVLHFGTCAINHRLHSFGFLGLRHPVLSDGFQFLIMKL